ncbi:hypothetical protein AVEN_63042-1 [Araneus ventricosus]|uniref:Uncharacterized protein n=1 Tax=Araneus ventricosus TaxID=182803 RepID=A0A4Y2TKS6_ARAVE|nr:hypothetical protein AVEN_63042-1 [Araneus ventricosus]
MFHSLLAGIHGTKPCGSQLPYAGGFQQACMEKSAGTSVAGLQDSRFRFFRNGQGRLSGQFSVGKRPGCSEPPTPLEVAASPALRGKGARHGRTHGIYLLRICSLNACKQFQAAAIMQPKYWIVQRASA